LGIIAGPAAFLGTHRCAARERAGWCFMAEQADHVAEPAGVRFEARCSWCGPVTVGAGRLGIHVGSGSEALLEYACPRCDHLNVRPLRPADVAALAVAGVHSLGGAAPFELLEERSGPPIGWDDLLDFHQGLSRQGWQDRRWSELEGASADRRPDRMRDAA
jgi:phage FluMu protein Com